MASRTARLQGGTIREALISSFAKNGSSEEDYQIREKGIIKPGLNEQPSGGENPRSGCFVLSRAMMIRPVSCNTFSLGLYSGTGSSIPLRFVQFLDDIARPLPPHYTA